MQSVHTRLLQPTWLVFGLMLVTALLAVLAVSLSAGAAHDTDQLVGPFRWLPDRRMA